MADPKIKFKCYRCGNCCKINKQTTLEEFKLAFNALKKLGINLKGNKLPSNMVAWPKHCPALKYKNGQSFCIIYAIRPFPCRQFLCGKSHKMDNKLWFSDGNFNKDYFDKLINDNPYFTKIKKEIEDKAALWGNKHGWNLIPC